MFILKPQTQKYCAAVMQRLSRQQSPMSFYLPFSFLFTRLQHFLCSRLMGRLFSVCVISVISLLDRACEFGYFFNRLQQVEVISNFFFAEGVKYLQSTILILFTVRQTFKHVITTWWDIVTKQFWTLVSLVVCLQKENY